MSYLKAAFYFLATVELCDLAYYLYQTYFRNAPSTAKSIFLRPGPKSYGDHFTENNKYSACDEPECFCGKLTQITEYISKSKRTLDVCFLLITNKQIKNAIINACKRGVQVRVMLDETMEKVAFEGACEDFVDVGIPVRVTNVKIHHKFLLIDVDRRYFTGILLFGSLNLTTQGVSKNWENIMVFENETGIIVKFHKEFESLWNV